MSYPTETEARLALESVRKGRQQVVDEIGMPWWYGGARWRLGRARAAGQLRRAVVGRHRRDGCRGCGDATVSQRVLAGRQRTAT